MENLGRAIYVGPSVSVLTSWYAYTVEVIFIKYAVITD